jgi:arylformamidase
MEISPAPRATELERDYTPSSATADFGASVARYRSDSDAVLDALDWGRLAYGDGEDEFVCLSDRAATTRPIHLFLHGGYWQELSWRDALFPVSGFVDQDLVYGAINYSLAPAVTLAEIIDQCRRAVAAVSRASLASGGDGQVSLSGSSAGAHLAAAMATTDWARLGLPINPVAALVLLSGIYDLRPLVPTSINDALRLDPATARRLSPILYPAASGIPALIAWGEEETNAFKQQSKAFAAHWHNAGSEVTAFEVAGRSHFSIVFDLSNRATRLGAAVSDLIKGTIAHL